MYLSDLRKMIGEENFDKVPECNKIYINVDDCDISVGLPKKFTYGMRAVSNLWRQHHNTFLTFSELLKEENIHTLSDGCYDIPIPKGTPVPLDECLDDWGVYLSDKLEKQLKEMGMLDYNVLNED